jgi:hypothetical protein
MNLEVRRVLNRELRSLRIVTGNAPYLIMALFCMLAHRNPRVVCAAVNRKIGVIRFVHEVYHMHAGHLYFTQLRALSEIVDAVLEPTEVAEYELDR